MALFSRFLLFCLFSSIAGAAQVSFTYQSSDSNPQGLRSASVYPSGSFTNGNGVIITRDRVSGITDTNGSLVINYIYGGDYRAELQGTFTVTTNWYHFPVTNGLIRAADYLTAPTNGNTGYRAYTTPEVDNIVAGLASTNGLFNPTNATVFSNLTLAVPGFASNYFFLSNVTVLTRGEDSNHFVIGGAGTASVNGTNYTLKSSVAGVKVWTNDTGTAGLLEDPSGNSFNGSIWTLTNGLGADLYDGQGPVQSWSRVGGANPPPSAALSGYGFSTNQFTQFVAAPYFPEFPADAPNVLYVATNGNNYSAVRGNKNRPWKSLYRAYTNAASGDAIAVGYGLFDERAEWPANPTVLPKNVTIKGKGIDSTLVIASASSKFSLNTSNVLSDMTTYGMWAYLGDGGANTNVVVCRMKMIADGDVWVSQPGVLTWDPYIIDCDFRGNSDKIAVLTGATVPTMTSSRIYIVNTLIQGGVGADGDGMNRGTLSSGRANFVLLGVHSLVTAQTNSMFMGLSSQVSTSGSFTATSGFFGPGSGITALTGNNISSGTLPAGRLPALTGDVTSSAGSAATTIANNAVTFPKLVNATATQRFLGRNTAGSGNWEEVTASQALDWIGATRGSVLYRGASGWAILTPGTSGTFLQSQGVGADPTYAAASGLGYTIALISSANTAPLASSTYYVGGDFVTGIQTTYSKASMEVPKAGTIKRVYLRMRLSTVYPSATVNHWIRVNDTTDIANMTGDYSSDSVSVNSTGLSTAVNAGDTLALKITTPAWGSTGTGVRWYALVYIE